MEVYIVRHGQTIWNAEGKLQGHADIELNESGRSVARELGSELADVDFDCIYSSPLVRAYETACLIRGEREIPIVTDDRLKEISFGELEGIHYTEWLNETSPYRFFFDEPAKYNPPPMGESLAQVRERTKAFLQEVIEPCYKDMERIMIVAHGALNKGLMCYIEDNDQAHYWGEGLQKNCEATIFKYDGATWSKY